MGGLGEAAKHSNPNSELQSDLCVYVKGDWPELVRHRGKMTKKRKAASPLQSCSPSTQPDVSRWQSEVKRENDELRQELGCLKQRIQEIEREQDIINQRSRLMSLILSGPTIPHPARGEEALSVVQGIIKQLMKHVLDTSQVRTAFRLRSGNILVEFCSAGRLSERDILFRSKSKLRGTGLYISESLTPRRQDIFRTLLQLKKTHQIHSAYTQ